MDTKRVGYLEFEGVDLHRHSSIEANLYALMYMISKDKDFPGLERYENDVFLFRPDYGGEPPPCSCGAEDSFDWDAAGDCDEVEHAESCTSLEPNFLYKPDGYEIIWYKYPLRGAFASRKMSDEEFRAMIGVCMASVELDRKRENDKNV